MISLGRCTRGTSKVQVLSMVCLCDEAMSIIRQSMNEISGILSSIDQIDLEAVPLASIYMRILVLCTKH
jgi:Asp-tRNA(Asn)/Glu-tRNA(Gln) amidotransferase C subunit